MRIVSTSDRAVSLVVNDTWPTSIWGEPAAGRSAHQIVDATQASIFPDANHVYSIPLPELGYVPGAGDVYEVQINPGSGSALTARVVIMVAERKGLAVGVYSVGPLYDTKHKPGHPDPAGTVYPYCWDWITNSVTWPGDQPL